MLSVSLVVLGGVGMLLGSLVLLVVCSGINDRVDAHPQPSAGAGIRDEVTRSADYYPFRSSEESGTKPIFQD
jgi:hypothetical protein